MAQNIAAANQTFLTRPSLPGRAITDLIDICLSAAERDGSGKLYLRNMPTVEMRQVLSTRRQLVVKACNEHDQKYIAELIADMLASYDVAQSTRTMAAERRAQTTVYVRELRNVPTWAVQEACEKIRIGAAPEISHHFKPTPIQVYVFAVSIARPWKEEARLIGEILHAPKFVEGVSEEERAAVGIKWRSLSDAIKEGSLGGEGGLKALDEIEEKRKAEFLKQSAENSKDVIRREWAAAGRAPPMAGNVPVSRALAKLIETAEAEKKALAEQEPDPMVL